MARLTAEDKEIIIATLIEYLKHPSVDGTYEKNRLREKLKELVNG